MKLKMAENSLCAILLRSPWWASVLAALAVFGVVRLFMHEGYALFAASPFIVIAAVAGWKRLRMPGGARLQGALPAARAVARGGVGGARLEAALAKLRGMPWEEFAAALEAGFRREGYAVKRLEGGAADFELTKA